MSTSDDAVAVREAERLFVRKVLATRFRRPPVSVSSPVSTSVTRHGSGFAMMHVHLVLLHVEGDVGHVQEVVGEVLLDHVALVATADHEIVDAVRRVELHDVPEDRLAADLDHGLRFQMGLLGDPGARVHRPG